MPSPSPAVSIILAESSIAGARLGRSRTLSSAPSSLSRTSRLEPTVPQTAPSTIQNPYDTEELERKIAAAVAAAFTNNIVPLIQSNREAEERRHNELMALLRASHSETPMLAGTLPCVSRQVTNYTSSEPLPSDVLNGGGDTISPELAQG